MSDTVVVIETVTSVVEVDTPGTQGPPGEGVPIGGSTGQVLTKASAADFDTEWAAGGAGADDQTAAEVPFTPAGGIAATDVQAAIVELDSEKAAASHAHAGEDITSGTVADARIAATIARDSEVTTAVSNHSADTTSVHGIADTANVILEGDSRLTDSRDPNAHATSHADAGGDEITTALDPRAYPLLADTLALRPAFGVAGRFFWTTDEGILYRDSGTAWVKVAVSDYPDLDDIPATFAPSAHASSHQDGGADEISLAGLAGTPLELTNHLNDAADAHDASAISVLDTAGDYTATDVEGVLAEIAPQLGGGATAEDENLIVAMEVFA